jgi:hypothetical protein
MSHTTTIDSVVFNDIDALKLAVTELQKSGVKCQLKEKATPRAFYANQQGMDAADYVLQLADSPYDVGFYKHPTLNGYVARTDMFMGHVEKILGVNPGKNETREQAALGKLNQMYAVNAAARQAARQGYTVRRVTKADGTIQLVMNVH